MPYLYPYGMSTIAEARAVLVEAEAALRRLMEEGIRQHRYGDVAAIAALTEGLTQLLNGPSRQEGTQATAPKHEVPARTPSKSKTKPEYPRFERDGDKLVKIGWSKKHKDQYEHRAPREAVIGVARHLARQVKVGQVFEVESLFPVPDSANREIPAYQVYLTLAWLRTEGAVDKKGRDGHVLRDPSIAAGGFDKLWERVPIRAS